VGVKQAVFGPGTLVSKSGLAVPATTTSTLFTVTGGAVLVTALLGRVTTAVGATVTTLSLGTGLGGTASLATAVAITSKGAGTWLFPIGNAGVAGALQVLGPSQAFLGGTNLPNAPEWPQSIGAPFLLAPDTITWTTSATPGGGVVTWYLSYIPIDTAVAVS